MNKEEILPYEELYKAYLNVCQERYKYIIVLNKIKEEVLTELQNCKPKDIAISMEINYIEEKLERLLEEMK